MENDRVKLARDEDVTEERVTKVKRHDFEVAVAEVDIRLAEKLDSILNLHDTSKPKFFTNKPRGEPRQSTSSTCKKETFDKECPLKPRNLTKEELKDRLVKRYDSLVPELDPKRTTVKLVKILSTSESMQLGKDQAQKQLERQLELNSISGNQLAHQSGSRGFRFNDGYEMPMKSLMNEGHQQAQSKSSFKSKPKVSTDARTATQSSKESKSVRFAECRGDAPLDTARKNSWLTCGGDFMSDEDNEDDWSDCFDEDDR